MLEGSKEHQMHEDIRISEKVVEITLRNFTYRVIDCAAIISAIITNFE